MEARAQELSLEAPGTSINDASSRITPPGCLDSLFSRLWPLRCFLSLRLCCMIAVYRFPFKMCVAVNLKRQQLRVFCLWDIENIPIPRGPSAYSVACAIHQELASLAMSSRGNASSVVPHSDFSVFHNPRGSHSLSRKVCKELTRAAVKLVDIGYMHVL
jgi:hypothetical protein